VSQVVAADRHQLRRLVLVRCEVGAVEGDEDYREATGEGEDAAHRGAHPGSGGIDPECGGGLVACRLRQRTEQSS